MAEAVAYLKRARQNGHTLSEEFNFDNNPDCIVVHMMKTGMSSGKNQTKTQVK
jgi:hypothetical protein